MSIRIEKNTLTKELYHSLREKKDFIEYQPEDVEIALENSLFSVVVFADDEPVGIGRIVGDDRIVFFIKDVVVKPSFRKMGIGKIVMKNLIAYIEKKGCDNAYIGLMSTPQKEEFYEQFGFIKRPTEKLGHGMVKFL